MPNIINTLHDNMNKMNFELNLIDLIYFEINVKKLEYLRKQKKKCIRKQGYGIWGPNYSFSLRDSKHIKISGEFSNIKFNFDEIYEYNQKCLTDEPLPKMSNETLNTAEIRLCFTNSLIISNGVTLIDNQSFSNCYSLKLVSIPNTVKTIGQYAFSECCFLKSITIPSSVDFIGDNAFIKCKKLINIIIDKKFKGRMKQIFTNRKDFQDLTINYTKHK